MLIRVAFFLIKISLVKMPDIFLHESHSFQAQGSGPIPNFIDVVKLV